MTIRNSHLNFHPGLLQAVLNDPVLLQAVDPQVLQAVLVSAAAVNVGQPEQEFNVRITHQGFIIKGITGCACACSRYHC